MAHAHTDSHSHSHGPSHYVKIWAILLVLFVISVCGPMFGIRWLTLITAFGIAIVKAYIVAAEFMHLKMEKRLATLIMASMLVIMVIFFFGVAPDVMQSHGERWVKMAPVLPPELGTSHHAE